MLYFEYLYYLIASAAAALLIRVIVKKEWAPRGQFFYVIFGSLLLLTVDWGLYLTTGDRLPETTVKLVGCRINPQFKVCRSEAEKPADVAGAPTSAPTSVPKNLPTPSVPSPVAAAPVPVRPDPAPPPATAVPVQPERRRVTPPVTPSEPPHTRETKQGAIPEDIIGIRTGTLCRDALGLIEREYPNLTRPLRTGGTRYSFEMARERIEVLADTITARSGETTVALTCMPVGGQSVVVYVGSTLSFEKDGRNFDDIERLLIEKYGALAQRMNVAAVNPFNLVRMGRVYGPDGVLPAGSKACGDFQATGGWVSLGQFGGAYLNPLRLDTCLGGLFILYRRNSAGRVLSTNIEVWDFRLASRAAEDVAREKDEEIKAKSKSRLKL